MTDDTREGTDPKLPADQQNETESQSSPLQLDAHEARVLGALMEKERTTPEAYPLTQNALISACNQKSSREPVMNLSPGEVGHTLRALEGRGLLRTESGSRSERFAQLLGRELGLNDKRQALVALLLLRGPQTVNELLSRSARLADFHDAEAVQLSLLKLIERPAPLVVLIPRQAGQRDDRYAHLLSGEPPVQAASQTAPRTAARSDAGTAALEQRVEQLERAVAELQRELGVVQVAAVGGGGAVDGDDANAGHSG